MKITAISVQKRRKDRYSIYVDGAYRLSLSENELIDSGLRQGDELTETQLEELARTSDLGKALDKVYNYLSYRPRSRQEIVIYLRRKQYDDEMIQLIIARLEEQNIINDSSFARDWVESRQLLSPRSLPKLRAELREKGVASDIIEQVLGAHSQENDDVATITQVIEQKGLLRRYDSTQKLIRYLSGQGFSYSNIKAALERLDIKD